MSMSENHLTDTHKRIVWIVCTAHILITWADAIHTHVIRRWIFICKQKHMYVCMSSVSDALERQAKNPPLNLLPTRLDPLFTQCAQLYTHRLSSSVFGRHAAALSTGSTCSEENTSGIGKNCLFFPPASLLIRGPPAFTCHTPADRQMYLCACIARRCRRILFSCILAWQQLFENSSHSQALGSRPRSHLGGVWSLDPDPVGIFWGGHRVL